MVNYLWVFILTVLSLVALLIFFISFSKDLFFIKKLKKSPLNYLLNFSLIAFSAVDIGLVIYLFQMLKKQIGILG